MGRRLAEFLEREIERSDDDRVEVIERMGRAADISAGTVNQILRGDIDCPPLRRLRGFARALDVSFDRLMSVSESDGCDFATAMNMGVQLAQHLPRAGENKEAFFRRCQAAGNSHPTCNTWWEQAHPTSMQIARAEFQPAPFSDLPISEDDFNPRGQSDSEIVAEILGDDRDFGRMKRAHLLFAPGDDRGDPPNEVGAYKLPIARMVNGRLTAFRSKVSDAIGAINGARTPLSATDEAKRGAYNSAVRYLVKAGVDEEAVPPLRLSRYGLAGESTDTRETDVAMFDKDIIRQGVYHHPVTGETIDVTAERMDGWVATFNTMKENGVDVEAVADHSPKADDVLGYIESMRRENGSLRAVHKMKGQRGINLAKTVKNVSILLDKNFQDGSGRSYGEAITHVAIVQQPVISGQEAFVPLSVGGIVEQLPILRLQTKEAEMEEFIKELRKIMGAGDDLTEDNALSRIGDRLKQMRDEKEALDRRLVSVKGELETAKATAASAKSVEVDPDTLDDLVEAREAQADALVESGNITPKVAASLKSLFIGEPESRNVLMLSRKANGGVQPVAKQVLDILKDNHVVELVEKTGPQVLALSHTGQASNEPDKDAVNAVARHVVGGNGQV